LDDHDHLHQRVFSVSFFSALSAQKKLGAKAYDFGGEEGLKQRNKKGGGLKKFNIVKVQFIIKYANFLFHFPQSFVIRNNQLKKHCRIRNLKSPKYFIII